MIETSVTESEITHPARQPDAVRDLEPFWSYALLGWLIGTVVPVFGFGIMYFNSQPAAETKPGEINLSGLFLLIGFLCSMGGLIGGAAIGGLMFFARRFHWAAPIIASPFLGLAWGIVAGGAGGFPVFVVGALFGAIVAAPFGIVGFLAFSAAYEPLARRRGGALGWRGTALAITGTLTLLMLGELLWFFVINK